MLGWPHMSGRFRLTRLVIAAIAITWLLAACSGGSPGGDPSPTKTSPVTTHVATPVATSVHSSRTPAWLLTRAALSQITKDNQVKDMLQGSPLYELLQPGQSPLPGIPANLVITFSSATTLEQAVRSGQIPAGTYGVLYDPEAWSYTPRAEQQDPVTAATNAAAVAHAHGLKLIVAPALNLTTVLAPGNGSRWQKFLQLDLISQLAKVADVIELQAQSLERDTTTYASFVSAATSQATAARSGVTILAGLSTNPPGAAVTTQHLLSAIAATRAVVNGYWLNVPGQGPRCPTCNASRPDIAIQILQQIG
jgi:hypothetical protein